jgi:hypothetical protein
MGPFGNVYSDMEHALIAFRYLYASSCPHYSELFRMEHDSFAKSKTCRRFGSSNGLSLLQTDPDDRVWYIIRDKCMFDIVYQRICRDVKYRSVLRELVRRRYLPVYHVRTADTTTYWGATMNKELLKFTNKSGVPSSADDESSMMETLAFASERCNHDADPSSLLVGQNRLGQIMVHAYNVYREVHEVGVVVRNVVPGDDGYRLPSIPITPIHPHVLLDHTKRARDSTLAAQNEHRRTHAKRVCRHREAVSQPPALPPPTAVASGVSAQPAQPEQSVDQLLDDIFDSDVEPFYITEDMLA